MRNSGNDEEKEDELHRRRGIDMNTSAATADGNNEQQRHLSLQLCTERFWLAIIACCVLLFVLIHLDYHASVKLLAPPFQINRDDSSSAAASLDNGSYERFSEAKARIVLERICGLGTRHTGSTANEVHAVKLITEEVHKIIETSSKSNVDITLDTQSATGCFNLDFRGNFTNCYENITNILVKFSPSKVKASASILVNCHFDSAISSPGASDDMVSCVMMLETLRVLSATKEQLKHSIIFLFNGAEETGLQASHGFITQHLWAKEVKAFINLEAAGAGGKEMVFQTGPNHPWLVYAYAQSVNYPFASVVAQEIFQSGIIPSDTDFRIFRDFGKIPGIDIAYAYNGYIYHTKYDQPKYIPEGCIQRGGENLLALVKGLGNSDKLVDPGDAKMGKMVFFDVLGHFMVYYPQRLGDIINTSVVVAALVSLYWKVKSFKRSGRSAGLYIKLICASYTMHAAGYIAMIVFTIAISLTMNTARPMMWFTNNWLCFPLYILPAISVWIVVHQHGRQWFSSIFNLVSIWELESVFFEAGLLFWTILLAALTMCGIASSYVCMLLVVFPLLLRQVVVDVFNIKMHTSPKVYLILTAVGLLLPFTHLMQSAHLLFYFFIPLMGRTGSERVPDVTVAVMCLIPVIVITTYLAGLLHVSKVLTRLAAQFLLVSALVSLIAGFTSLGFPYSGNPSSPSAQRHSLQHYWREFHAYDGSLEKSDHGLMYLPFDYNGHRYLQDIDEMKSMEIQPLDPDYAYAGFPYHFSLISQLRKLYVSKLARPRPSNILNVQHSKEIIASDVVRHHFIASGGHTFVTVYVSLRDGADLTSWSFTSSAPPPAKMPAQFNRPHYFVYLVSASHSGESKEFWLDVKVPPGKTLDKHWLDIGFGVHYLDGPDSMTPELESVLNKFPNWTVPLGWVSTLQHYRF